MTRTKSIEKAIAALTEVMDEKALGTEILEAIIHARRALNLSKTQDIADAKAKPAVVWTRPAAKPIPAPVHFRTIPGRQGFTPTPTPKQIAPPAVVLPTLPPTASVDEWTARLTSAVKTAQAAR